MKDPIVQTKQCRHCQSSYAITQGDIDFYSKISPTFAGQKFIIPIPTLCPSCRQRRRLSFRNERHLYKRKCDFSGKEIISIYKPQGEYTVYDQKIRRSDAWDPMDYGRDFDFSKTFTEQFGELMRDVPRIGSINIDPINSEYVNCAAHNKDCYLCFDLGNCESSMYCRTTYLSKHIVDSLYVTDSEYCYQCVRGNKLFNCTYTFYCTHSSDLTLCTNCSSCSFCYLCNDLTNQTYCYKNVQYSKEDYFQLVPKTILTGDIKMYYETVKESNFDTLLQCEDCTGSFQRECKNCMGSNGVVACEDAKRLLDCYQTYSSFDSDFAGIIRTEHTLETIGCENGLQLFCAVACFLSPNASFYVDSCHASSHLFGCIGLRNKSYCIFNKQYTKDDYETTVAKIIAHIQETSEWGEFFHPSLSPFGYNETVAQEYYPATVITCQPDRQARSGSDVAIHNDDGSPQLRFAQLRDDGQSVELSQFGYHRSTYNVDPVIPTGAKVVDYRLPVRAVGTQQEKELDRLLRAAGQDDELMKIIFLCELSGRPFRVIKAELEFYRKHTLPLPRKHPDVRHLERLALRR